MSPSNDFGLAFLITAIGVLFFLIVLIALVVIRRIRPAAQPGASPISGEPIADHGDAVLVVEVGGRVKNINTRARQYFHLQEGELPNLERLARKVRPPDALLNLCTSEGMSRFMLEGRLVEGTSYLFTTAGQASAIITLRYPELAAGLAAGESGLSAQTLQTFTQLTQAMAASLDLNETLQAVLENIEKLIPADFMEVTVWDPEDEDFIPYRFSGLPGVDRKLQLSGDHYSINQGMTGYLYRERKALLVPDLNARPDLTPAIKTLSIPLRAYLGLPLLVGNEFVGTVELGSMEAGAFREEDLDLVRLLSGQAAIALHNALLYQAEQQRTAELSGLSQLAQAVSSLRDQSSLFPRLVESIAPLLPVEILGFLIYNENLRVLQAHKPFHGLPDQFVEIYSTQVVANSMAEKMLLDQDLLISENASEDEKWVHLGMEHLAQAASLRETVLVPLASGGHMLGYLQASNHIGGAAPFSKSELHLMTIIANQTASIIENSTLVQQSRQRAQRAEALRRITSLASSSATLDEILLYSIQELGRILRADVGAILLFDQEHAELKLHYPSVFGTLAEVPERMSRIPGDDPQYHFTITGTQHPMIQGNVSQSGRAIIPFYQTLLGHWGIESVVAVPLLVRSEGIGELWFGSQSSDFFDQADSQVVATAAGQLAGVVEQTFLRSQTDETLRRRVDQMMAITRISRELSTSLDLNYLLNLVYDEALRTTLADCGTILLFDLEDQRRKAVPEVRFFVGDMPDMELSALERLVLQRDEPINIPDISRSEFKPPHAGVLSTLIVPISYQRRTAGMICLHGKTAGQFDSTAMEISQSLAVQAAIALNNALAYEEQTRRGMLLKRELETLTRLIQVARVLKPTQSLRQALTAIAQAIQSATPFQVVLISIYETENENLKRLVGAGVTQELWDELRSRTQPWRSVAQLMQSQYRIGGAYYIPENQTPTIPPEVHVVSVLPSTEGKAEDAWHEKDLLLIPMYDASQNPLGLISVDAPADNRRPDKPTFEALEVFAAQASIIIESHQRAGRLEVRVDELEREQVRLEQAKLAAQSNLPVMLHKELEQSIALRGLNQRMERIRASLEIAVLANRQENEAGVLRTLASEMLTRYAMQVAFIAEKTSSGIRLVEIIGNFPAGSNPEALFGQRNPLRQMLQQAGSEKRRSSESNLLLVANTEGIAEWQNVTMLNVLEARSMIGMPLEMAGDRIAGVLVIGQRALPAFLEEDRRVFEQLVHQVSVGLQNLQLLNETRRRLHEVNLLLDFSSKLGSLQPDAILSSLVENIAQVLPNAHAAWVGIWEEKELSIIPHSCVGYASPKDIQGIRYALQSPGGDVMDTRVVLPLRVFRTGRPERVAEVDFANQYHLSADDLLRYRKATNGRLPISAMVIPLRVGDNVLGVVFLENFDTQGAFTEEDEALASSFTRQAAMALENARLYQASERRATQLQALTVVAGTITSSLQSKELISLLLDQLKQVLPYDTATLWLRIADSLTVAAATGFPDNELRLNLSVAVEDSELFKNMIQTGEPISVGDLRNDKRFPMLMEPDYLSWLGIPLMYKSQVIGLIALEKRESDFYTADYIQAGTAFASQAAVSLENARLFEESVARTKDLDERSQRLALLNRLSSELVSSLDIDLIFQLTGQQLLGALEASGVAAVMLDQRKKYVLQVEVPGHGEKLPVPLPEAPLFEHLRDTQGIFQSSNVSSEKELKPLLTPFLKPRRVHSMLVVPLVSGSALQGWFLIYRNTEYRYNAPEIELARTMCNQAAIAIQNARLFAETRRLTEDLERRVEERTRELRREHQNSQTLLHIITELSTSLDMGLVLNRTLGVLNESIGCEESLISLSQNSGIQYRAGMQLARMMEGAAGPSTAERQISRWVIRSRQPVLVTRVQEDNRWEMPSGATIMYQSVMAVPLVMGEEVLGALLLFHRQAGFFTQDQISLLEATARQIAIALSNAELFNLIRDQSEHLGSMLREQQIEASRSRAILEAVADGVLVTDAQSRVTLFNASAEGILNLKANQVLGKSLEHFSGLFGKTATEWLQTIRSLSADPTAYPGVNTYAEQIELDNGRIAAVHLAPVFWRQDFLGTVSIFRDITHEVQVDRLKSEFVANVSHELRTPMTSIKGYVEIMLMGASGELNPQQTHFLQIVRANTERLSVLVNDLLDISRMEAGRVSLNFQPLDIHEIAEDVITDMQRRSREENKPMQFTLEAQPGLPFAQGDTERIRQVLGNLVSNGYNYTPENGCVTVRIRQMNSEIQVDVIDNGIGIEPDVQHRIFERFYRGEDSLVLATAGTGLGLAIAKTLVEMHHGRIWFQSPGEQGVGSTFSFTLPFVEEEK
jgi:PAS domain S-box-containing protein